MRTFPICSVHGKCGECRRAVVRWLRRFARIRRVANAARAYARRRTSADPALAAAAWHQLVVALDATRSEDWEE